MLTDWPFYRNSFESLLNELRARITNEQKTFLVTANPAIMMQAYKNAEYRERIRKADIITPDGIGIVKGCKWFGKPVTQRLTGFDLMSTLLQLADKEGWKVYLLGATAETLVLTKRYIQDTYPNATITGCQHGYFASDRNIVSEIQETRPDLIFVAMGCPKQESWIADNLASFEKGIFIGVGGSFDVLAGTDQRAPQAWINHNLEWLYRIIKKPKRIVLLKDLAAFIGMVIRELAIHYLSKREDFSESQNIIVKRRRT